jgi:hypothetical protein
MFLIHDSNDDVPIQSSLNNLVVTEPSSSNLEAIFPCFEAVENNPFS